MNFKKPKEQVIADAEAAAYSALYSNMGHFNSYGPTYDSHGRPMDNSIFGMLQVTIARAIGEAVRSIVNNTYTDQEFEEDIQLRDKT